MDPGAGVNERLGRTSPIFDGITGSSGFYPVHQKIYWEYN
jgi:hypothetical protein